MNANPPQDGPAPTESVWDFPRPPRLEPDARHVVAWHRGVTPSGSRACRRVLETSHPPVFHVPPDDVRSDLLVRSYETSVCEWKGAASYWTPAMDGYTVRNLPWSYEDPSQRYRSIAYDFVFYPGLVDLCTVGGERVRAQPGDFYGGWVTDQILEAFKSPCPQTGSATGWAAVHAAGGHRGSTGTTAKSDMRSSGGSTASNATGYEKARRPLRSDRAGRSHQRMAVTSIFTTDRRRREASPAPLPSRGAWRRGPRPRKPGVRICGAGPSTAVHGYTSAPRCRVGAAAARAGRRAWNG